jgi:anti-anti-sigma regulatory factor
MDFTVDEFGDVRTVRIAGNLDTQTAPVAQEQLMQLIDDGTTKILVDFEDCAFRNIRSLVPTTSGQPFRSIRSP